ncbi:MAG: fumarylacetoacetate hydrolase, partial [Nitrospinota bacterium]
MRIVQFFAPRQGPRLGVVQGEEVIDISGGGKPEFSSTLAAIQAAAQANCSLEDYLSRRLASLSRPKRYAWQDLNIPPSPTQPHLLIPVQAPEVWGCGITYQRSAEVYQESVGTTPAPQGRSKGIYDYVYHSERPELFFKATPERCVGPNAPICIRSDSTLTAPEPELAYVLGREKEIVGFTICNDLSAWDIERENPLFLPQSKIFLGCCALGPTLVTPSDLPDPRNLSITCRIVRGGQTIYSGTTRTSALKRTFEELNRFLYRDNV